MLRESAEARRTLSRMDKTGRRDIGDELAEKPSVTEYKQLTRANDNVQAITREINQIYADPYTPPEVKREKVDALYQERIELYEAVVKDIESQREQEQD